jgi:hypothetical protein
MQCHCSGTFVVLPGVAQCCSTTTSLLCLSGYELLSVVVAKKHMQDKTWFL